MLLNLIYLKNYYQFCFFICCSGAESEDVFTNKVEDIQDEPFYFSDITSSPAVQRTPLAKAPHFKRIRATSTSSSKKASKESVIYNQFRTIYATGRPPWYNCHGKHVEPFIIGICGGSASGKTTVAAKIIKSLGVPWVTLLSMDSFYKVNYYKT